MVLIIIRGKSDLHIFSLDRSKMRFWKKSWSAFDIFIYCTLKAPQKLIMVAAPKSISFAKSRFFSIEIDYTAERLHNFEVYNRISLLFGFNPILMEYRQEVFEWCGNRLQVKICRNFGFERRSGFWSPKLAPKSTKCYFPP